MSLVHIISNLPWIITIWSSVILSWSLCVGGAYWFMIKQTSKQHRNTRKYDIPHAWSIYISTLFFVWCIWFDFVAYNIGDAMVVINVFYTLILFVESTNITHWIFAWNNSRTSAFISSH